MGQGLIRVPLLPVYFAYFVLSARVLRINLEFISKLLQCFISDFRRTRAQQKHPAQAQMSAGKAGVQLQRLAILRDRRIVVSLIFIDLGESEWDPRRVGSRFNQPQDKVQGLLAMEARRVEQNLRVVGVAAQQFGGDFVSLAILLESATGA